MPEICRFYGIVIKMYFADHAPPHFHAEYSEHEARIAIHSLAVLSGRLPPRAMGLVAERASLHQEELQRLCSVRASKLEPLNRLPPLP
jgi:hypothetical protein